MATFRILPSHAFIVALLALLCLKCAVSASSTYLSPVPTIAPKSNAPVNFGKPCTGWSFRLVRAGFTCFNGVWLHQGSWVVEEHLRIEADSSPVYVQGNVSFGGGSIYLTGYKSGIQLSGCFKSYGNGAGEALLILDYSRGWPKTGRWYQEAIIQSPTCFEHPIDFSTMLPSSCKVATITPRTWTGNGLYINWTLSSRRCVSPLAIGLGVGIGVLVLIVGAVIAVVVIKRRRTASRRDHDGLSSDYEPLIQ